MNERATPSELTEAELEQFKTRLRALRAEVVATVEARLHGHGQERHDEAGLPRRADDTDDDAAAEAQRSMDIAQLSHTTAELAEIDAVLSRLRRTDRAPAPAGASHGGALRAVPEPSRKARDALMTASRGVAADGAPSSERLNTGPLFGATVLIWGTTWFAITFQLHAVAPELGVALRFLVASLLVLGWCVWRGLALRLSASSHAWLALQGACGFSLSYVLIYHAERLIVSGLVAVGYAAAPLINMLLARVFFRTPIAYPVAAGGALGVELQDMETSHRTQQHAGVGA